MPDNLLIKAYQVKRASRNSIAHRAALALAEFEEAELHKAYLSAVHARQQERVALTDEQLDVLALLLSDRGLSDVEDDTNYQRTTYAEELSALMVAQMEAIQMEELVHSRADPSHQDDDTVSTDSSDDGDDGGNVPFMGLA